VNRTLTSTCDTPCTGTETNFKREHIIIIIDNNDDDDDDVDNYNNNNNNKLKRTIIIGIRIVHVYSPCAHYMRIIYNNIVYIIHILLL